MYYYAVFKTYLRVLGFSGAILLLKAKLFGLNVLKQVMPSTLPYSLTIRIPSTDVMAYEQVFLDNEYDFEMSPKSNVKVVIDAGANVGFAAVYFANRFKDAMIFAIEPEANNFELLVINTSHYKNIIPIQAALWSRAQVLSVVDNEGGNWAFTTQPIADRQQGNLHSVDAISIPQLIADYGLSTIDILKMDIEGAEKEVMEDSASWIESVEMLVIETHDRIKAGCSDAVRQATLGFLTASRSGENTIYSRAPGHHE